MRLISVLSCIVLLLIAIGAGIPADRAGDKSDALLASETLYAQEIQKNAQTITHDAKKKPEPSTTLYQVMGVVLFIWIGLAFFLFMLDRRVAKLEQWAHKNK